MQLTKTGILRINYRNIQCPTSRLVCNFKCSYCITQSNKRCHFDAMSLKMTQKIWNLLETIDDRIIVRINFDGETLIDNWAKKCVYDIGNRKNVLRCELITNNSINPNLYLSKMDITKMSFCCSYHPEFITIKKFINHLKLLKKSGCPVFVYVVATPQIISQLDIIKKQFNEEGFDLRIEGLMGNYNEKPYPLSYSTYERNVLKKLFFSLEEYSFSIRAKSPNGKLCYAGTDQITVFMDGKVARCYEYYLGDIKDFIAGKKSLSSKPQPCFLSNCLCPAYNIFIKDIRSKYKLVNDFADHYEQ